LVGPAGVAGPTGAAGATGATGLTGAAGAKGDTGLGLTNSAVGTACAVTSGALTNKAGTLQWLELAAGVFVMSCDTN
jgi:hypothetical protein